LKLAPNRVTKAGSTSENEGMSGIHRTWIDSWDKTKESILNGEVTEEQAASSSIKENSATP
jgi:hypothetical protein